MHSNFHTSAVRRWRGGFGFTLIELLIVIAIILILIAIALPNFLEAQERARVTRGKAHLRSMETAIHAHLTQYTFLYSDYNDPFQVARATRNKNSPSITSPCPLNAPLVTSKGGLQYISDNALSVGDTQRSFYSPSLHCPLTTPIKFLDAASTVDPWSDGTIPVGMDSRYITPGGGDNPRGIIYSAYFISGPDRLAGHWQRGRGPDLDGNGCPNGLPYGPTNGTKSEGDLWMIMGDWAYKAPFATACETAKNEYGGMQKT